MTDLQHVLRAATEHLPPPDLAGRALEGARRRRVRRSAAGALAAVVLLGGAATWAVQDRAPHAGVVDAPLPAPSPTVDRSGDSATQAVWDPFAVARAPRVRSVLPSRLAPPPAPPALDDAPLPDVVVAWPEVGADLRVLGSDGSWRTVSGTASAVHDTQYDLLHPAISSDGSQVAMATNDGILVVAATGARHLVPWPDGLAGPRDLLPRVLWRPGTEGFVVLDWRRPWLVGPDGTGAPLADGTAGSDVMVDPDDGTIRDRDQASRSLRSGLGTDDVRAVALPGYGERLVTRFGRVAYTGNPGPYGQATRSGPVVVDPATGTILGYAPVEDPDSVYSDNAYLSPMGFTDPDTVLLMVGPMDFRTMDVGDETRHLVTWDFVTGDFGLVTSGDTAMSGIAVAPALVLD